MADFCGRRGFEERHQVGIAIVGATRAAAVAPGRRPVAARRRLVAERLARTFLVVDPLDRTVLTRRRLRRLFPRYGAVPGSLVGRPNRGGFAQPM